MFRSRQPAPRRRTVTLLALGAVLATACSDPPLTDTNQALEDLAALAAPTYPVVRAELFGRPVESPIPDIDTSLASVELSDVIFDTFGQGPLTLAQSTFEQRSALLDAIPPIDDPPYVDPTTDPWLQPTDPVLGFVDAAGQAYASPHLILALHEIVNVTLAGEPLLISYCPLCNSGVVFSRLLDVDSGDTETLSFSNTSALYDSDLVMVDRETGSYWWQVAGRAIVGPLTDVALTTLPSTTATWSQWQELHPDTLVLSRDLGFGRDYTRDRFEGYRSRVDEGLVPFPVQEGVLDDARLTPGTQVILVGGQEQAIAVPVTNEPSVARLSIDGRPVVVLSDEGGGSAFSGVLDGRELELRATDAGFVDGQTGRSFDLAGKPTDGEGPALDPVPSRSSFWFAVVGAFPDVTVAVASR